MSAPRDWIRDVDDYTSRTADDGDPEVDALEAALFDAAANGDLPELAFLDTLATIAPWFGDRAGFSGGLTREQTEALRAKPHVHYIDIEASGVNEIVPWPADTKLVAYRVSVDMRGYRDIVSTLTKPNGEHHWTFHDAQFDPSDGNLYAVCDEPVARTTFLSHVVVRIEGTREGKRETVATFELRPVG